MTKYPPREACFIDEPSLRDIAHDFLAGAPLQELASEQSVTVNTLVHVLSAVGFWPAGDVARRYWHGEHPAQIASAHGLSERTVYRMLIRYELRTPQPPRQRRPVSKVEVLARWAAGESVGELARAFRVDPKTIRRRIKPRSGAAPQVLEDLPVRDIAAAFLAGATLEELAAEHGAPAVLLEDLLTDVGFLPAAAEARSMWSRSLKEAD
ncbi:helix-turn-helix domain-containing protein [Streptomyces sp. NPDC015680]|uniref:helix-turn-helix domain-containing protein n=1 Tax=Streptomyces sp. NPDC015680 TaxID=3364962 RepID=UPI0036F97AD4